MTSEQHVLVREFPEYRDTIEARKSNDLRFHDRVTEYDDLTREIERIEAQGAPVTDEYLEGLKKKRLHLKDELYDMLQRQ